MQESQRFLELKEAIRQHLAAGNLGLARKAAEAALVEAENTGDGDTIDLAVCNRSMVAILEGRYDETDELARLRPILLRTTNTVVAFSAAYNTASVYKDRRDLRKAVFYAKIARDKAANDHPGRGHAFNQLGTLYLLDNRIPEAIEAFERARTVFVAMEPQDRLALAILDDNLGYAYLLDGRHTEGFEHCQRSLEVLAALGAETFGAQPHLDLCFGYLETQQLEQAMHHGAIALDLARRHGIPDVLKNALYLLGEARYLAGDQAGADACFDELAGLYPEVRYLKDLLFSVDLKKVINLRQ